VHRAWLGSAPNNDDKYACLVPDIVYRNFRLVDYDAATPVNVRPAQESVPVISVFPSPVHSTARITVNDARYAVSGNLAVYNINGTRIHQFPKAVSPFRWNASQYPNGRYFIMLKHGEQKTCRPVKVLK
jgi:hypothetical protein